MQMERARRRRGDMNPSSSSPQHSSPHPTSSNADSSVNDPVDTDQHLFEQTHTFSNHSAPSDSPETTTTSDPQVAGQLNGHVTPTRQRRSINKTFSSSPQSQSSGSHLDTSSPDSKMAPSTGPSSPARTRGAGKRAKSQIPTEAPPILPPQSFLAAAAATRKSKRKLNETPSNDTTPSSSSQDTPVDGTISRGSKRQKVASTINDEPATETTKAKASTRKRAGRSRATQAKSDSTVDTSVNTNGRKGSSSSAPDEVKSSSVGPSRVSTRNKDKPSKAVPTTEPIANGRTSKASKVRKSTRRTAADAAEEARVEDDNVVGVAPNNADDNDSLDDEEAISQQVQTDLIEASSVESNVPLADDNADAEGESVDENDEVVDHNTDGVAHKTNDTAVENSSTEVFNKDAEVEEEDYDDDADADGDVDSQIAAEEALVNGIETEAGDEPATAQATDDEEDAVADDVNDDNDGVAAIVDGEGEQAVSANGKEDVEADEAEAEVNGGLEGEDVNVEPEVTERPKRGRPGRPGKGMRGAKTNNLPRPALPPRAGSKIAVKGKQAKGNRPGWQGKRKLADNWKLQAYYDRQATLKQQYKGLAKIILQSKQILLDKAIEKIKETEPLHYKDEPEYEQLNSELTTRFDERKGKLDARHALDKTQIQTLYERNVDVEQRIYQRAIEDAREDALFNAKQAILGLVKGHFQRSDNPDAPIVNDDELHNIKVLEPPKPPIRNTVPERLDLDATEEVLNELFPDSIHKGPLPPQLKSTALSPRKGLQGSTRGESSAMAIPKIINNDDDDYDAAAASGRQKSSIMGDRPAVAASTDDGAVNSAALGSSLRSLTSTPALVGADDGDTPADSVPGTPQPSTPQAGVSQPTAKEVALPGPTELWFPNNQRRGQAVPHNRLVGLPWFQFDDDEIGLRSMGHEGKGPPPEKGMEKQYNKEIRKTPYQRTFHYDRGTNHRLIEAYQPGEIDPDLAEEYGCHPRWGIPLAGCENPEYYEVDENGTATAKRWNGTDFNKPLPPSNPVVIKYSNSDELFDTSRSAKYITADTMFESLVTNIRMTRALGNAGLLDRSATELTSLEAMARHLKVSKDVVSLLLDAVEVNDNNPDQAQEYVKKVRELQETRARENENHENRENHVHGASPQATSSSASPSRATPGSAKRQLDGLNESRPKRRRTADPGQSAEDESPANAKQPRHSDGQWLENAFEPHTQQPVSLFPPNFRPIGLEALADMAERVPLAQAPIAAPPLARRHSSQSFIQYAPPQMQQQQQQQHQQQMQVQQMQQQQLQQQRPIYPAPMPPHPQFISYPQPPPQQYRMTQMGQMGPPPPPSPAQQQPQHMGQSPRSIVPGSGLRNIMPRPEAHFYQNAAVIPQYSPMQHPQNPPQYPAYGGYPPQYMPPHQQQHPGPPPPPGQHPAPHLGPHPGYGRGRGQ